MAGCYYENLHCLPYVFLGKKLSKQEDLKEMGDISSGMSSSIMQLYLKQVLEAFFHNQSSVRHFALSVIALTLNQGLIHPVQVWSISPAAAAVGYSVIRNVGQMFRNFFFFLCETKVHFCFACNILMIPSVCVQCVPYLIAMGTDPEASMRNKADQQLVEIDKKYTGFIHVSWCAMSISYFLFAEENNLSPSRIISAPLSKLPNCFFKYLSNMNGFCDILLFNEDVYKARNTNTFFFVSFFLQMKAVAGMKMSYSLQQSINSSRRTIIRGFRQDETHSALCSHLFSMIRGNRQHRRAFLISLLKLFDDSAVSNHLQIRQPERGNWLLVVQTQQQFSHHFPSFVLAAENGGQHAAVCRRQLCLLPIPEPGRASLHNAPHRHHSVCVWQQLVANF